MNNYIIVYSIIILLIVIIVFIHSRNRIDSWNHFIPSQFDNAEIEIIPKIEGHCDKYINGIINMDLMASKANLYKIISNFYNNDHMTLVPKTWIVSESRNDFTHLNFANNIYILKKDIQQQKGLQLISNYNELINCLKDPGFVVLQEFLKDPFIIDDKIDLNTVIHRKINMRIYLLITVYKGHLRAFIYNDGFLYYTPDNFIYSTNFNNMITTGYIERSIYERNPLTLQDLKIYTDSRNYKYDDLWNIIKLKLSKIILPYIFIWSQFNKNNYHYQIFGVDIEPNSTFTDIKIIEINKGPDLTSKDDRDSELKTTMIADSYQIVLNQNNRTNKNRFEEL